jgi:gas vesicle protein
MAMGRHKEKLLWNVLLGSSVYLLDSLRERLSGNMDDVKERARDTYETATDRVSRATDVIRGEDHPVMGTAAAILIGVGIGVGVGMLLAPASGEETRSNLAEKVQDFGSKIRSRASSEPTGATGTYGE